MATASGGKDRTGEAVRRRIAVTIGDAAIIGAGDVVGGLADGAGDTAKPIIIGDIEFLRREADKFGIDIRLENYDKETGPGGEAFHVFSAVTLPGSLTYGVESEAAGKAAGDCIVAAVDLWKAGEVDAISTAPISKRSLRMGGHDYPGHTEFLAALTGTSKFAMSFFADRLRVVLVSTHLPLRDAIEAVTPERLEDLIRFTSEQLERLLGRPVKIAVAGINPHASENGMFGTEEAERITPAIERCRDVHGIEGSGPDSPDTIFLRGYRGAFDAVIACYHDQATIAVKSLSFGTAVNVTLGLPLIRTSVDHGTAFDIAGQGVADASSMAEAIRLGGKLAEKRKASAHAE